MTLFAIARPAELMDIRFATSPVWETIAAVRTLRDGRSSDLEAFLAPRARGLRLAPLLAAQPRRGYVPDFLSPPPDRPLPRIEEQLAEIRSTPPDRVSEELARTTADPDAAVLLARLRSDPLAARDRLADLVEAAHEALVAPLWPRIAALVEREITDRSRTLARSGLRAMLDELHPQVRWVRRGVSVRNRLRDTVSVGDRGLLLMPSAFIWPSVAVTVEPPWRPTITYPVRGVAELWFDPPPPAQALAHLLGRGRATILRALDRPHSTTGLAATLAMSPAGVSRHLAILRDARLASPTRHGHEVRYSRTPLGDELVRASGRDRRQPSSDSEP